MVQCHCLQQTVVTIQIGIRSNCFEVQIEFRTYFGSQSYFQTLGQWYSRLDVFRFMEIFHGRSTEKIMIL